MYLLKEELHCNRLGLTMLGPEEENQSPGNSVAMDSGGERAVVSANERPGWSNQEGWAGLLILTRSRLNEDGAQLVIPNREGTLTLETGLGSKRKAALHSEKRTPVSCHGPAEDSEGS